MGFPPSAIVPGTKPMVIGSEIEICKFENPVPKHYQITVSINQFIDSESIEFRFYTKRPQDSLFYQEGAPVTFNGNTAAGGGDANGQKHFTIDFRAGIGVRITGKQTGGVARTVDWFCINV